MKKLFSHIVLALFIITSITSCSSKKTGLLVPADAAVVVHINMPSLSKKLSWKEIQATSWFKQISPGDADTLQRQLMEDPENSGIDTDDHLTIFIRNTTSGNYLVYEGTINDMDKFVAFNNKISKNASVVKDDEVSSMKIDDKAIVSWDKKHFAYVVNIPTPSIPRGMDRSFQQGEVRSFSTDSLIMFGKQTLDLSGSALLDSDKRFGELIDEDGDIHFWMNSGKYYTSMMGNMMSLMKLNLLFDGNISAGTFSFDDGKISIKGRQYYGEELSDLIDKYESKNIDESVLNRIPSENIVAAFALNYPPEGLHEFIKLIGVDGMVNSFLGNYQYSLGEFIKANKGDMVVAVTDMVMTTKTDTIGTPENPSVYTRQEPEAKYLFSVSVNDRTAFDKLIGTVQQQMGNLPPSTKGFTYKMENNWFTIGNDETVVNRFLQGGNNKNGLAEKIGGHPFGAYVDIQRILKSVGGGNSDSLEMAVRTESLAMWKDMVMTGGEFKKGAVHYTGEINLINNSTNSLKQLNTYLDKMGTLRKSRVEADTIWPNRIDTLTTDVVQ